MTHPQDSGALFAEAAASLKRISRPADVPQIVELIGRCPQHDRRLCLLAVCSKQDKKVLAPHQPALAKFLCESIHEWPDGDAQLTASLKELGVKLAHTDLLKKLAERYSGDTLTHGRGDFTATVMQAHGGSKEDLMEASLAFARLPANAQRGGLCARQLRTCAEAGMHEAVGKRLLDEEAQGFRAMLENGSVLDILGPISKLVEIYCVRVGGTTDPHRRTALAHKCAVSLLAIQLSESKDRSVVEQLLDLRQESDRYGYQQGRNNEPLTQAAAACRSAKADADAFGAIAQRIARVLPDAGVLEITKHLVRPNNGITEFLVERVFIEAKSIDLPKSGAMPDDSALRQFEAMILPDWRQHLGTTLPAKAVDAGKLNRAVLDFIRRNNISFVEVSKSVLASNLSLGDVDFVLESLACSEDGKATDLLAQCCGHHETDRSRTNHIRTKAIELLGHRLKAGSEAKTGPGSQALVAIHAQLLDTPSVRMASYRACGTIGDLGSIRPLRDRQTSETDTNSPVKNSPHRHKTGVFDTENAGGNRPTGLFHRAAKAKHELLTALNSLKARLISSRPSTSDAEATLQWINYVGELGDGTLLNDLNLYLSPSHPNQDVVLATLDAIGRIGNVGGVQVVQEYVNDTAPPAPILAKARRVRMALEQRNDTDLFENLARFLPGDSPALNPAINYESLLGPGSMRSATKVLRDCGGQLDARHWDDFVTRMNGIFELMVRVVYLRCNAALGIDDARRTRMLKGGEYHPLINCGEFKQTFPSLQAICQQILVIRRDAAVAHAGNPDGSEKAGIDEEDATLVKTLFAKAWPQFVEVIQTHGTGIT